VLIAHSEGLYKQDQRTYVRLFISAVRSSGSEKQVSSRGPGAHRGYESSTGSTLPPYGRDCARTAVTSSRRPSARRRHAVAIENGFGGVLFHEASGTRSNPALSPGDQPVHRKLGTQIASPSSARVDDGTLPTSGLAQIDDEGTPTRRNLLIDRGILSSYMIDKLAGGAWTRIDRFRPQAGLSLRPPLPA
jgi:TldD protein